MLTQKWKLYEVFVLQVIILLGVCVSKCYTSRTDVKVSLQKKNLDICAGGVPLAHTLGEETLIIRVGGVALAHNLGEETLTSVWEV